MSNLLLQGPDLVVLGHLVILSRGKVRLQVNNLTPELGFLLLDLATLAFQASNGIFLSPDPAISFIQLLLDIHLHGFNPVGLVNNFLDSRTTRLEGQDKLILLIAQPFINSLDFVAFSNGFVNVGFSNGNLFFILSLVLGKLGALEVGLDSQVHLPPKPGLANVVVPDGPLETVQSKLLVLHFLEDQPRGLSSGLSLKPRQNFTNPVFTNFFHETQNTSSEEYLGVTKTPLLRVKSNSLEDTSSSILVLLSLSNSSSSQDIVTGLELRIQNLVREALPTNGNTSQHTITLVLMHNQARFNHSRLFVGVGYNTTNEGRISSIQSLHQIIKLTLVEGSDSLATTLLLTTTTSILLNLSWLTRMIIKDVHKKRIAAILEKFNDGVIEGIFVLLKPSSQVVGDSSSIMDNSKMC